MRHCKHSEWLDILAHHEAGIVLRKTNRVEALVNELPCPQNQRPSLWLLLGGRTKSALLKSLLTSNVTTDSVRHARLRIHLDASTAFGERPTFIVDGDLMPHRYVTQGSEVSDSCHQTTQIDVPWVEDDAPPISPMSLLCSRIVAPFADVVCIFLTDYPEIDAVAQRLATWIERGKPSTLPTGLNPHLLLVTHLSEQESLDDARSLFLGRLSDKSKASVFDWFSGVSVVALHEEGSLSPGSRYRVVKERLLDLSHCTRLARAQERCLFAAQHWATFLSMAVNALMNPARDPLDFIHLSRQHHPVPGDLSLSLTDFLSDYRSACNVVASALSIIASSFLLDHYLPEMHRFGPVEVFQTLYAAACSDAFDRMNTTSGSGNTAYLGSSVLLKLVQQKFEAFFRELDQDQAQTAAMLHLRNIRRFRGHWDRVHSVDTCFACLRRRRPPHALACGHRICAICVQVYGRNTAADVCTFSVSTCPMCAKETETGGIAIKPGTASLRVLSIDGGGARAVLPLENMELLNTKIGVPLIVNRAFDMAVGTSSGGLVVLALFLKGWSVTRCLKELESLSATAFTPRNVFRLPLLAQIQRLLLSYVADGLYPSHGVEGALRHVFGHDRGIDEPSFATRHGIKVGLPVTTVPGTRRCLFTNYNGAGNRSSECGYSSICAPPWPKRLLVWEVARAITAAPGYFTAFYLNSLNRLCQDGGMWRNNPVRAAFHEGQATQSTSDGVEMKLTAPAYVVSLGTGSLDSAEEESADIPGESIWRTRTLRRLWDFLLDFFRGHHSWQEFVLDHPELSQEGRLCRLDVKFDGAEPALDDVSRMPELRASARKRFAASPELHDLARLVITEMFYFELSARPEHEMGHLVLHGHLRCRWKSPQDGFEAFDKGVQGWRPRVLINGVPQGTLDYDIEGNLGQSIKLRVRDAEAKFAIQIQLDNDHPRHIGGSPFTVVTLLNMQKELDTFFGTPANANRKRSVEDEPDPRKRRRLL